MDLDDGLARIGAASSPEELTALEHELFGRKHGQLTEAMKAIKGASPEEKREKGRELNQMKTALEEAIQNRYQEMEAEKLGALAKNDPLDITMDLPPAERGHLHLVPEFIRQVEEVFGRMGFDVAYGPEIETEENNFDLLNIPADHPARDLQDTFWIKGGGKRLAASG